MYIEKKSQHGFYYFLNLSDNKIYYPARGYCIATNRAIIDKNFKENSIPIEKDTLEGLSNGNLMRIICGDHVQVKNTCIKDEMKNMKFPMKNHWNLYIDGCKNIRRKYIGMFIPLKHNHFLCSGANFLKGKPMIDTDDFDSLYSNGFLKVNVKEALEYYNKFPDHFDLVYEHGKFEVTRILNSKKFLRGHIHDKRYYNDTYLLTKNGEYYFVRLPELYKEFQKEYIYIKNSEHFLYNTIL